MATTAFLPRRQTGFRSASPRSRHNPSAPRRAAAPPPDRRPARACRVPPLPTRPSPRRSARGPRLPAPGRSTPGSRTRRGRAASVAASRSTASRAPGREWQALAVDSGQAPYDFLGDALRWQVTAGPDVARPLPSSSCPSCPFAHNRASARPARPRIGAGPVPDPLGVDQQSIEVEDDRVRHGRRMLPCRGFWALVAVIRPHCVQPVGTRVESLGVCAESLCRPPS